MALYGNGSARRCGQGGRIKRKRATVATTVSFDIEEDMNMAEAIELVTFAIRRSLDQGCWNLSVDAVEGKIRKAK